MADSPRQRGDEGRKWPGIDGLDPILGHRIRLGICVLLASAEGMTFRRLQGLLNETDGSLGANLKSLEDARFILTRKRSGSGRPESRYEISASGRRALESHLAALSVLIDVARKPKSR